MIISSNSINPPSDELCNFIVYKMNISKSAMELGLKRCKLENSPLPIVMWSYGLINTEELDRIYRYIWN